MKQIASKTGAALLAMWAVVTVAIVVMVLLIIAAEKF